MITIIFGAGASFDSLSGNSKADYRPPLANNLFEERAIFSQILNNYRDSIEVASQINISVRKNSASLEEELENYAKTGKYFDELVGIKFYLRDIFREVSNNYFSSHLGRDNYSILVHFLKKEVAVPVNFITFNYDTLLENAIGEKTGYKYHSMNDYNVNSTYKLLKLHGSSNWGRVLRSDLFDHYESIFDCIKKEKKEPKTEIIIDNSLPSKPCYPAIGLPVTSKDLDYFECPESFLSDTKEVLAVTDKLIVIGWKGMESHFNENYLSKLKKNARVQIISSNVNSAMAVADEIQKYALTDRFELPHVEGFSGYIADRKIMRDFILS